MRASRRVWVASVATLLAGCGGEGEPDPASQGTGTAIESPAPTESQGNPHGAQSGSSSSPADSASSTEARSPTLSDPATAPPGAGEPSHEAGGEDEVTLAVVGDLKMAHRAAEDLANGFPQAPFAGVAEELSKPDLTLGNLETAVGTGGDKQPKTYTFLSPPGTAESIAEAGFDYVSLANNHTYDYGVPGIQSTVNVMEQAGVATSGAGEDSEAARAPAILESQGQRIAVLSYLYAVPDNTVPFDNAQWEATDERAGVAWAHPAEIAADVEAAAEDADHVMVMLHSGLENQHETAEFQEQAADAAIEAGATAVLGHHSHVLQGYEYDDENGTLIAWGLGNFVFDGYPPGAPHNDSAILTFALTDEGVQDIEFLPARLVQGYPELLAKGSSQGKQIVDFIESLGR